MKQIRLFFYIFSFSVLLFLSGCVTKSDPLLDDVPEFEVRTLSFVPAGKSMTKKDQEKSYLMRWNILGPIEAEKGKNIKQNILEGENLLCGSVEAPDEAYWHVRIFNSRTRKVKQTGLCNWTKTLSGYKGRSLFYACNTLLTEEEYKNVTIHLLTAGEAEVFLNGKNIASFLIPNLPGTKEYLIEGVTLKKGANRLILKYLDKTPSPSLRAVAVRFSMQENALKEKKIALIR